MKNQRKIDLIVVHCSATRVNQDFPVEALEACHKARGFHSIGYHYYITKDGKQMGSFLYLFLIAVSLYTGHLSKIIPSFFTIKEGSTFLTKPLFNGLYTPFGSPVCGGTETSGTRGCNRT